MQLLKLQCGGCHRFRIRNHTIVEYEQLLKLLRKGALFELQELEEIFKQERKLQKIVAKEEKDKEREMNRLEKKGDKGGDKAERAEK